MIIPPKFLQEIIRLDQHFLGERGNEGLRGRADLGSVRGEV